MDEPHDGIAQEELARGILESVHFLWFEGGGGGISHLLPLNIYMTPPPPSGNSSHMTPQEKTKNVSDPPSPFYIKYNTSV